MQDHPIIRWFVELPWYVKGPAIVAGFLMSSFSSQFPPNYQALGYYCGIALALWVIAGTVWHWTASWETTLRRICVVLGVIIGVVAIWELLQEAPSVPPPSGLPSVILLPEPGRLVLYNKSSADLYLWGDKFDDDVAPNIEDKRRTIPFGGFYYFLTDKLEAQAKTVIGANGEKLEPFEVYISDKSDRRYIAKFDLLIKMKDGNMTVHTQQLGLTEADWVPSSGPALNITDVRFAGGVPIHPGPLNIEWRIVNSGKSDAVIYDNKTTPVLMTGSGRLPDTPTYMNITRSLKGMKIVPGIPFPGATVTDMSLTQEQVDSIKAGTSRLFYYGYIKYGLDKEFAFISVYEPRVGYFVRDEDEYPTYSRAE